MIGYRLICLGIGYLFGLFQTSYFVGRAHHIDIRKVGSGNAGSTNTLRVLGRKAGLLVLLGDVMKCVIAILLAGYLFREKGREILPLLKMYTAAGCVLGHNYPFYLGFKGGKGIAASLGMMIAIDWRVTCILMTVFLIIFFTTHYVSLGSIFAYFTGLAGIVIFGALGFYGMDLAHTIEMDVIMALLTLQAIVKHRENIKRLMAGTERKTYLGSRKKSDQ